MSEQDLQDAMLELAAVLRDSGFCSKKHSSAMVGVFAENQQGEQGVELFEFLNNELADSIDESVAEVVDKVKFVGSKPLAAVIGAWGKAFDKLGKYAGEIVFCLAAETIKEPIIQAVLVVDDNENSDEVSFIAKPNHELLGFINSVSSFASALTGVNCGRSAIPQPSVN